MIDVSCVNKRYRGKIHALRDLSLTVPSGRIFGLLGPNGAGKSTLVKILLSIVKARGVRGVMLGHPIGHRATLGKVGYLPEHARFPSYLSGRDVLRYTAGLANVPSKHAKQRSDELLELVGMSERANTKLRTYSKGMKQRIGIAQALINNPEVVFLDEPTDGVDPQGRREMRDIMIKMRDQGRTVFINSHLLGELEMVCDNVAILNQGQVVKHGELADLTAASRRFEIHYQGDLPAELQQQFTADGFELTNQLISMPMTDALGAQPVIDALRAKQLVISELKQSRQSLEDLFIESIETAKQNGPPPEVPKKSPPPLAGFTPAEESNEDKKGDRA